MIRVVRGRLEAIGPDRVVVEVGPVSLEVQVPASAVSALGSVGSPVCLYTHLAIRDERPVLYGFPSDEGRRLFELLLTVSGVGPRLALALLSHLGPREAVTAIARGDVNALAKAPGVGQKTASRIVLELKGRLEKDLSSLPEAPADQRDLLSALLALGYSRQEAREAVQAVSAGSALPLEERLRRALEHLGEGRSH
ncbi:Holliday junction ATP-dependent DNA helicase RuvA [bacterium HR23]|nr:Holliday junction ATP-dependent DNA helicase RuvA [bacterium HR23]